MTSVPQLAHPQSAVLLGSLSGARRKYGSAPGIPVMEILSAALAAEDRAMTEESAPLASQQGKVSGFGDRAPAPELVEAEPAVLSGRSTLAPGMAIARAHRQRRTGLEETVLSLYYGNLSLFRAEETARTLWGDDTNGAVISTCTEEVVPRLEEWLKRPLTRRYDFVFLDKLVIRQRLRDGTQETGLRYAVGVDADGVREVLGVSGATTDEGRWAEFLRDLRRRGLKQVRLFIGGVDESLVQAAAREFPAVRLQICVAQLEREVLARVSGPDLHAAIQACAVLHPKPEAGVSGEKIRHMLERLDRNETAEASALLVRMLPLAFSYRPFPRHQWSQISTIDAIRRAVKPLRERIRHTGPIDEPRALVLLAAAHLRHISRTVWGRRSFLRPKPRSKARG